MHQKLCVVCGAAFLAKSKKKLYCSKDCRGSQLSGAANPNFRAAGERICQQCGMKFQSYNKGRRFCSHSCYAASIRTGVKPRKPKPKSPPPVCKCEHCGVEFVGRRRRRFCDAHWGTKSRAPKMWPPPLDRRICPHCGGAFEAFRSSSKRYCSYACHVASGGAIRAGLAAARATRVYGAKKDANHKDVLKAIEKMGASYIDISALGCGAPDLVVDNGGKLELWEVKNPKTSYGKRGLNKNQVAWAAKWRGSPIRIIRSVDDVVLALSESSRPASADTRGV